MKNKNKLNIPVYRNIIIRNGIEYWYGLKSRYINYRRFGIEILRYEKK